MSAHGGEGPTRSIQESIDASDGVEHVPVTFDACDHVEGPFFHGTRSTFAVGDLLEAGRGSNFHEGRRSNHVYFSALHETAIWGAELAVAMNGTDGR
ncbi:MAG TPA: NAD(+)--rifampin ADP-ribosyltransferase, partial [Acidimicrobiales bacterium]|nr:NAD(+)--rifampin ADP-ribosyltransferase [Acidimicrobiales bacterium]